MDLCVERLVKSGFTEANAQQICNSYRCYGDSCGLESFICSCEQYECRGREVCSSGL